MSTPPTKGEDRIVLGIEDFRLKWSTLTGKKKLWGGHLWRAGYYAASVEDKITAEMVKKYISHQRQTSFDW